LIEPVWNPEDKSNNAQIVIKQSVYSPEYPTLRVHKIKVGLFKENFDVDVIEVLVLPNPEVIAHYDGSKNYKAILLNF
jgi:hypothetical protein